MLSWTDADVEQLPGAHFSRERRVGNSSFLNRLSQDQPAELDAAGRRSPRKRLGHPKPRVTIEVE